MTRAHIDILLSIGWWMIHREGVFQTSNNPTSVCVRVKPENTGPRDFVQAKPSKTSKLAMAPSLKFKCSCFFQERYIVLCFYSELNSPTPMTATTFYLQNSFGSMFVLDPPHLLHVLKSCWLSPSLNSRVPSIFF